MKTIILLHRGGSIIRGSERCLLENASALRAAGLRVVLVRNDPSLDAEAAAIVDSIVPFDFPEIMLDGDDSSFRFGGYVKQLANLTRLIKRHRATALLANGGLPCQLGVPAARISRIPIICHFHHPAPKRYLYLWMVNRVDELIFPSNFTRSVVLAKAGRSGRVIYNSVDVDRYAPPAKRDYTIRSSLGIAPNDVVFGQIGALERHKRQSLLITAFAQAISEIGHAQLVLVGAGPEEGRLRELAKTLGIAHRVHFTGYVASTLPYYQHVLDVNVLASAEEGLGISALEGSAAQLPLIAADASGLREAVISEETGIVFPVDDITSLASCLVRLGRDVGLRGQLGQAGRDFVRRSFSPSSYRQGIVQAVTDLI